MTDSGPLVTVTMAGQEVPVTRVALSPAELGAVMGEDARAVVHRLYCGDLPMVRIRQLPYVHVSGAVALVEGKVAAGQLGAEAQNELACLIRGRPSAKVRAVA